jgi:hypothetical protein
MDEEQRRIAKTEALFRDVNERIAETSGRFDAAEPEFVCECGDPDCTEHVEVPFEEYERVRGHGARFVLQPGHVDEQVERVVGKRRGYAIVEKLGAVGRFARRLNPRAESA